MTNKIVLRGKTVYYDLQYKAVKNLNLRIRADGSVHVSASRRIRKEKIEEFLTAKADFILKALDKYEQRAFLPQKMYFHEQEIREIILEKCEEIYPYFEKRGVPFPQIRFRKMVSRWGSCNSTGGILCFNTNLMYAPPECIEYVVLHEFVHFLQPNHSAKFYEELDKVCPERKTREKKLKEIVLQKRPVLEEKYD